MTWEWVAFTVVVVLFGTVVLAVVAQTIQKAIEAKYRAKYRESARVISSDRKGKRD